MNAFKTNLWVNLDSCINLCNGSGVNDVVTSLIDNILKQVCNIEFGHLFYQG